MFKTRLLILQDLVQKQFVFIFHYSRLNEHRSFYFSPQKMYFHSFAFKVLLLRLLEIILKTFIEPEMASVSS